ncbi:hypothetical protein PCH_Pc21g08650 [Penicillium rubens Wisconsin 54-1255]|uniref:Uncharacterized protein n=1 Tax=Penicillium rubens (strain ATCC 28089 / DSM 1075 / NRRL 1951 / Wisconsin 54-1255) TaxID=500485 RepID=B6HMC3_PENRW|nr:hypothetical protein PCH_Pc21g08650 [Penicillium rubens Wisconsin 54-1255]
MQDGGSNSGVEIKNRRPRSSSIIEGGAQRERGLKKALSLEIGNEPGGISEPADQQCISGMSSAGRIDGAGINSLSTSSARADRSGRGKSEEGMKLRSLACAGQSYLERSPNKRDAT